MNTLLIIITTKNQKCLVWFYEQNKHEQIIENSRKLDQIKNFIYSIGKE